MCQQFINAYPCKIGEARKEDCRFGEGSCSFAHNEAEQALWALEKDGRFSITDFILQNRKVSSTRGFSLTELLKKYPGYFTFVCRDCFYGRPPRVSTATHRWDKTQVLAHVDTSGRLTLIDHRKFTSKSAFFRICKFLHFCQDQPPQPGAPPRQAAAPSAQSQFAPAAPTAQSGKPGREKVPYTVQEYCGACWRNGGIKSLQDGSNNRCVKRHPNFELNKAQRALIGWEPVNSRIITAKFITKKKDIKLNIIQCYAPTNDAEEEKKMTSTNNCRQ
nr:hypothetical protein BaRGS_014031 [Batillaria attramentaria]